jgi:hypothetical protein
MTFVENRGLGDIERIGNRTMSICRKQWWIRVMPVVYAVFSKSYMPRTNISSTQHHMASPFSFSRNFRLSTVSMTNSLVSHPKGRAWIADIWQLDAELKSRPKKDGEIQKRRDCGWCQGPKWKATICTQLSYVRSPHSSFDYREYVSANCGEFSVDLFLLYL